MSEMVERLASLICRSTMRGEMYAPDFWEDQREEVKEHHRARARLLIEAMRDPTRPMLRAASKSMSPGEREGKPRVSNKEKHKLRYQAMLDAALGAEDTQ